MADAAAHHASPPATALPATAPGSLPRASLPRASLWAWLVAPSVAVLAYWWVLHGWFLYDDFTQGYLLKHDANEIVGNWGPIFRDFGRAQFGIEQWVYYRAMMSVYLTSCLELFGVDPVALHAVNLVQHAILTLLVSILCSLYCRRHPNLAAICGGLWFAVHPVTVEPLAWFSGNTVTFELLARLGSITAFAVHLRTEKRGSLILSMALACLALLTKESAINVAPALVAVHLFRTPTPSIRELVRKQLLFVPIWVGYFLLRYFALGTFIAGSHGGATDFFAAVPENGPLQLRMVFVPFGGSLSNGFLLGLGALLILFAVWRGVSSRDGLFVLFFGGLWVATQFVPTALNRMYENLGGSRGHYGTLAGVALWIAMLVFGRSEDRRPRLARVGAGLYCLTIVAFFVVDAHRRTRFEAAWDDNRAIHAQLLELGKKATPERPLAVAATPYDLDGVPQLNRTAHFTLAELPFAKPDIPVLGLTTLFVEGGLGMELVGDPSPMRAAREFGASILYWLSPEKRFLIDRREDTPPLPTATFAEGTLTFASKASPFALEELVIRTARPVAGGTLRWNGSGALRFGRGRAAGDAFELRIDLTHELGLVLTQPTGGIASFSVEFDRPDTRIVSMVAHPRLATLALSQELRGKTIRYADEGSFIQVPLLPSADHELRLVLLAPNEPIAVDEVEPGKPLHFPLRLRPEFKRLFRLSRQKRFYYYFEARPTMDARVHARRALGAARSKVDWFHFVPRESQ